MPDAQSLSRRLFVRVTAVAAALVGARRARAAGAPSRSAIPGLEARDLLPVAYAVLPAELGTAGIERTTAQFVKWISEYREGEETTHPYGSDRLGRTPPSPAAKWTEQLRALNTAALDQHKKPFAELERGARTELVRSTLGALQLNARMPSPIAAPHVALAVLAHFLDSPDAVNLCYSRRIDPRTCRPLRESSRAPLPIRNGGRG